MIRMRTFLTVLFTLSAQPSAACHIFARWHYPWPQPCAHVNSHRSTAHVLFPVAPLPRAGSLQYRAGSLQRGPFPVYDPRDELPLPALSLADVIGGEADEATRARLMLHAILGRPR